MSKFTKIQVHVLVNRVFFWFSLLQILILLSSICKFCLSKSRGVRIDSNRVPEPKGELFVAPEVPKNLVGVNWDRRVGKPDSEHHRKLVGNYGDPSKQRSFEEKSSPPRNILTPKLGADFQQIFDLWTRSGFFLWISTGWKQKGANWTLGTLVLLTDDMSDRQPLRWRVCIGSTIGLLCNECDAFFLSAGHLIPFHLSIL